MVRSIDMGSPLTAVIETAASARRRGARAAGAAARPGPGAKLLLKLLLKLPLKLLLKLLLRPSLNRGPSRLVPDPASSLRSDMVAASGDGAGTEDSSGRLPVRLDEARHRLQDGAIDRVWAAYDATRRAVLGGRSTAKLTPERRALIGRRLRTWPVDDLVDAVQGWQHSPHNRGENDRGQPYCDLELLLRDAAHIERFRDLQRHPPQLDADGIPAGAEQRFDRDAREQAKARRAAGDLAAIHRLTEGT